MNIAKKRWLQLVNMVMFTVHVCAIKQESHLIARKYNHDDMWFLPKLIPSFTFLQFIGFVVVVGVIIAGYCYCRNINSGYNTQSITVVVPQYATVLPLNNYASPNKQVEPYPSGNTDNQNPILDYFRQQPTQNQNPNQLNQEAHKVQTSNPYITIKNANGGKQWYPNSSRDVILQQKIGNQKCNVCSKLVKLGEPSNIMIDCSNDHCFHLSCLGSYRRIRMIDMGGNGMDRCPSCKETYSAVVKAYCPSCKQYNHQANLIQFTGADDQLNTDYIYQTYGRMCQHCR